MTDNNYTKYIGKRMSWKTMQETFPNMWVCVSDYKEINTDSFNGIIESVCQTIQEKNSETKRLYSEKKKIYWNYVGDLAEGTELWELLN